MEPTDYLDKVQKELELRDIKIFFSENFNKINRSDLYKEIATLLSSYIDGNKIPIKANRG